MSLLESLTDPNSQSSLKPMPVPAAEARCIAGIPQNAPPCLLRSRQSRFGRGHLLGDCNHVGGDFGRGRDVCGGDGGSGCHDARSRILGSFSGNGSGGGSFGESEFGDFNAYPGCCGFDVGEGLIYGVVVVVGGGGGGDLGGGGDNIGRNSYGARNDFGRNFGRGFDHVSGNLRFG